MNGQMEFLDFGESKISAILISVSGGRTSHFMAWWMLNNREEVAKQIGVSVEDLKYIFVFANTGMEHDDTLRFMHETAINFGFECIWVEGEPVHGKAISTQHRITTYENAYRFHQYKEDGHPFHEHVKKYGVPNASYVNCTREMKKNAINSYMKSIGHDEKRTFYTAIGIRKDEESRCASNPEDRNLIYPLVDWFPVDEKHVLDFWAQYEWDLAIPRWLGNCVSCYEKCDSNLERAYQDYPEAFEATQWYETTYAGVGPEFEKYDDAVPRAFYRAKEYSKDMIARFTAAQIDRQERGVNDIAEHRTLLADERKVARSIINKLIKPINKQSDYTVISAKWFFDNWEQLMTMDIESIINKVIEAMVLTQKIAAIQKGALELFEQVDFRITVDEKKGKKSSKAKILNYKQSFKTVLEAIDLSDTSGNADLGIEGITMLFTNELDSYKVKEFKELGKEEISKLILQDQQLSEFAYKIVENQIKSIMLEVSPIKVMNLPENLSHLLEKAA